MMRTRAVAFAVALAVASTVATQQPELQRFRDRADLFQIDLPKGWRQLAPNEARQLATLPGSPADLHYVEPRMFYAVGDVDGWLAGRFGPWLWVVAQDDEWFIGDDFAAELTDSWRQRSSDAVRHELADVKRANVGPAQHPVLAAVRTSTRPTPNTSTKSIDVYAPSGGRQISIAFTCAEADFPRQEPEFRRWLATLQFAREARGQPTLGDKLWTPLIVGGLFGIVLLVLYKRVRRR